MSDYIPPAGWRVKGDDEVVADGDCYSRNWMGKEVEPGTILAASRIGTLAGRVKNSAGGGYILTPIVSPPATAVHDVHMKLHAINPRRHELIKKKMRLGLNAAEWVELDRLQDEAGQCVDVIAPLPPQFDMHPPATQTPDVSQKSQNDDRPPLDVYLPEIERKVNLATKDNPEILDWWRAEKERLASETGKRIGGAK